MNFKGTPLSFVDYEEWKSAYAASLTESNINKINIYFQQEIFIEIYWILNPEMKSVNKKHVFSMHDVIQKDTELEWNVLVSIMILRHSDL